MNKKDLPHPDILRKLLRYDPETGKLFWRERDASVMAKTHVGRWNKKFAGKEVATKDKDGYIFTRFLKGSRISAHRAAWAITHGEWPEYDIDHINGIRDDNRIENLRTVSRLENTRNAAIRSDNTSGYVGVSWDKVKGNWVARIGTKNGYKYLGNFENKNNAIAARIKAEKECGFHSNHGKRKGRG